MIPALIKRFDIAKRKRSQHLVIWGTGKPKREFLQVNDLARACIHIMNVKKKLFYKNTSLSSSHINVGSGKEITIKQLAELIKKIVGYKGTIKFDPSKPDGTMSKLMNNSRIRKLNWKTEINLENGLKYVYFDYKNNKNNKL